MPLTAPAADLEGNGLYDEDDDIDNEDDGYEMSDDKDHHDHDHHDDEKEGLTISQHHNTAGSPAPHYAYQILLRLRRLLLRFYRRMLLPLMQLLQLQQTRPRRTCKTLVLLICLTIAISDPPFYIYPYIISIILTITVQSILWPCHTWPVQYTVVTLTPIYLILAILFHHLATTTEVKRVRHHSFSTSSSSSSNSNDINGFNKHRHFYYMQTVSEDYNAKLTQQIHAISDFVNHRAGNNNDGKMNENGKNGKVNIGKQQQRKGTPVTRANSASSVSSESSSSSRSIDTDTDIIDNDNIDMTIEPLPVKGVKLFDNAIRFDFLLEFIQDDGFTADFVCLIESDVVVDTKYFTDQWYQHSGGAPAPNDTANDKKGGGKGVEFMYVQHVWGHVNFEAQNVGVVCVSKTASIETVRWLKLMSYLNDRRYCRLLIKPLLYSKWMGLPDNKQHVMAWDRDGGCTVLRPYCHYIHFTRPKGPALEAAMAIVKRGSFDVDYK
jgi:hypothetical protein